LEVVYLDRYALAVKYGINVINLFRQSLTFKRRLIKYNIHGYRPFVPAGIQYLSIYGEILMCRKFTKNVNRHSFLALLLYMNNIPFSTIKGVQGNVSDYGGRIQKIYKTSPINTNPTDLQIEIIRIRNRINIDRYKYKVIIVQFVNLYLINYIFDIIGVYENWVSKDPGS